MLHAFQHLDFPIVGRLQNGTRFRWFGRKTDIIREILLYDSVCNDFLEVIIARRLLIIHCHRHQKLPAFHTCFAETEVKIKTMKVFRADDLEFQL